MTKEITVTVKIIYYDNLCSSKCAYVGEDRCQLFDKELDINDMYRYQRCQQCVEATGDE